MFGKLSGSVISKVVENPAICNYSLGEGGQARRVSPRRRPGTRVKKSFGAIPLLFLSLTSVLNGADPLPVDKRTSDFPHQSIDFFDATTVHPQAKGFQCGDFDPLGRRVLFYPWGGYLSRPSGTLLSYWIDGDFFSPSSYEAVDLSALLTPDAQGFGTGFLDQSHWCYFAPLRKETNGEMGPNDLALRYDRRKGMSNPAAYETFRVGSLPRAPARMGWITGAEINGYAFFVPYGEPTRGPPWFHRHGNLLRYNSRGPFADPRSWDWVDLTALVHPDAVGYQSCAVKEPWIYLIPYDRNILIRYNPSKPLGSPSSYESVDLTRLHPKAVGYTGGIVSGPYLVLVPYRDLSIRNLFKQSVNLAAAYDTRRPLADRSAWSFIDLSEVDKEARGGYQFGWRDNEGFVHFCPTFNFRTRKPPSFVVWDGRKSFSDPRSWRAFPSKGVPTSTGAAYDGSRAYLVPWGKNGDSGRITRISMERE